MTPSLLLALLSCGPDLKPAEEWTYTPPEVPDWTSYDGTFTYTLAAAGQEPGCELVFSFHGEPAEQTCEACEYAFRIDFTYDAEASVNRWRCVEADSADFTWVLGFDADFYGYTVGAMWQYHEYGAYWSQAFYADLEGDQLSWEYNYYMYSYYYDYYFYSWSGTGTVVE